jgi:hypothetical protein
MTKLEKFITGVSSHFSFKQSLSEKRRQFNTTDSHSQMALVMVPGGLVGEPYECK